MRIDTDALDHDSPCGDVLRSPGGLTRDPLRAIARTRHDLEPEPEPEPMPRRNAARSRGTGTWESGEQKGELAPASHKDIAIAKQKFLNLDRKK